VDDVPVAEEAVASESGSRESGPETGASPPGGLAQRLLAEPRVLPHMRVLRTTLRTAHILAFSALYGGHVYDLAPERLLPSLIATLATGGAFMALEIYSAPVWLVQVRGVATFVKLVLVAVVAVLWDWSVFLLTVVTAIGVVTSHMPGRYRYYSLLHGRDVGHGGKG
jgi:hypothetical protein